MGESLPRCLSCGLYYVMLLAAENDGHTPIANHVTGHVAPESTEKVLTFSVDYLNRFHINRTTKRICLLHWIQICFHANNTFI